MGKSISVVHATKKLSKNKKMVHKNKKNGLEDKGMVSMLIIKNYQPTIG